MRAQISDLLTLHGKNKGQIHSSSRSWGREWIKADHITVPEANEAPRDCRVHKDFPE